MISKSTCCEWECVTLLTFLLHPHPPTYNDMAESPASPPLAEQGQPPLHVKKSKISSPAQNANQQCGSEYGRGILPGHAQGHGEHGGDQDVVDVTQHFPEGAALHHALVVRLQVDAVAVAPVASRQAQELEAVQGHRQGDIGDTEEVAAEPELSALFCKRRKRLLQCKLAGCRCDREVSPKIKMHSRMITSIACTIQWMTGLKQCCSWKAGTFSVYFSRCKKNLKIAILLVPKFLLLKNCSLYLVFLPLSSAAPSQPGPWRSPAHPGASSDASCCHGRITLTNLTNILLSKASWLDTFSVRHIT